MQAMIELLKFGVLAAVCATVTLVGAQEMPEMPKPAKEHEQLAQFAGDWEMTATCHAGPGGEPMTCQGTENAKMVGGFWLMGQGTGDMMGTPMTNVLTLGYDPKTKKYVGTFVCSMDSHLWKYTGDMDDSGKKLTLATEGPTPTDPSAKAKYRETLELVDSNHKTFTSYIQGEDGRWVKFATIEYVRKK